MGMDREADVRGVGAHFDCKRRFRDEVACRRPNDAAPDDPLMFLVEQDFGDALIAAKRQRSPTRRPGKDTLAIFDAAGLGFDFGQADPGHLRIGVGNRRNNFRVEYAVPTGSHFGRDLRLMHRLMGEHRLANYVADGKNMRNIRAHLLVDRDKAALIDGDACGVCANHLAVGTAADGDEQTIE